jgi:5-methylcytosine-specific restriction endonuclease McrA
VLLQALRAAGDPDRPHPGPGHGHEGDADRDGDGGVSAGTPAAPRIPGHPADPARCHLQDGPALSVTTAQVLGCTAALSWLLHDRDGTALDAGRRRRRPTSAQRRAARDRDRCRCRYPGCESRRTDLHHIQYWAHGGPTTLENIISLCPAHHRLVHDRGYLIAGGPGSAFTFYRPDGTELPACPALPHLHGPISDCHDAGITPGTIIPAWYGEHLDLDHAIYICFANAPTSPPPSTRYSRNTHPPDTSQLGTRAANGNKDPRPFP